MGSSFFPGRNPLNYQGTSVTKPPEQYFMDRSPTELDWEIYNVGDEWLDKSQSPAVWFKLCSKARQAPPADPADRAVWLPITAHHESDFSSLTVDTSSGTGTNPVLPDSNESITITGAQVASSAIGANVLRTNSLAASSITLQVQQSGEAAAQDTTLNGVCHFDSSHFNVANGFVTLSGGGMAIDSFIPDAGTNPVVPNASGQVTMTGGNGILTTGGTNQLTFDMQSPFTGSFTFSDTEPTLTVNGTLSHFKILGTTCDAKIGDYDGGDPSVLITNSGSLSGPEIRVFTSSGSPCLIETYCQAAGDPFFRSKSATDPTAIFSFGLDNSALKFVLSNNDTLGTNNLLEITPSGFLTFPLQPAIWLHQVADITNATGATAHEFTTWTVLLNQTAGSYAAGVYTIPSTGNYFVQCQVTMTNIQTNHTDMNLYININGAPVQASSSECSPGVCRSGGGSLKVLFAQFFRFTAGNTVSFGITVINGANIITIAGSGGGYLTVASIFKVS